MCNDRVLSNPLGIISDNERASERSEARGRADWAVVGSSSQRSERFRLLRGGANELGRECSNSSSAASVCKLPGSRESNDGRGILRKLVGGVLAARPSP